MENSPPSPHQNSRKLAFFGTADFSAPSLRALIKNDLTIEVVVTKPDRPSGRGRTLQAPLIKQIAVEHSIPVVQPVRKDEIVLALEPFTLDGGIVVAYGMILPPEVLSRFNHQLINAHASLLPRWRGPAPIEAALLAGDNETGVTLMQLAEEMDSGNIYTSAPRQLMGTETKPQLYDELSKLSANLLVKHTSDILEGSLPPKPQDESSATYCALIKKSDGVIDWQKPATILEREIRAYLSWPKSKGVICGQDIVVTAARAAESIEAAPGEMLETSDELRVSCGEGSLIIESLIPAGKREMSGQDFLKGYRRA